MLIKIKGTNLALFIEIKKDASEKYFLFLRMLTPKVVMPWKSCQTELSRLVFP